MTTAPLPEDEPNGEKAAQIIGKALLSQGVILEFDVDSGALISANEDAINLLEMSEDGLSAHSFQDLVVGDRPAADIWWEFIAGTTQSFLGGLSSVLSGAQNPMHIVLGQVPEKGVVLHGTPLPETHGSAEAASDTGGSPFDALADLIGIIEYDADGVIQSANDRAEMALEFFGEDMTGKGQDTLLPPGKAMSEDYIEFWQKLREGRIVEGAFPHVTNEGTAVVLQSTYVPVRDDSGMVNKVVHCLMDASETHIKAQQDKARAEAVWQGLNYIEYDMDGHVQLSNDVFATLLGFDASELQGKPIHGILDAEFAKGAAFEQLWSALKYGDPSVLDVPHLNGDGKVFWTRSVFRPIKEEDGTVVSVQEIAVDIHSLLDGHKKQSTRFDAIQTRLATAEFSLKGTFLTCNKTYRSKMGFDAEDLEAHTHADTVPQDFRNSPRYKSFWEDLIDGKIIDGEFRRLGPEGQEVWFKATYVPFKRPSTGSIDRIMFFAIDITALKHEQIKADSQNSALNRSLSVMTFDLDGKVMEVNATYAELLGYTADEVVGLRHSALCDDAYANSEQYRSYWEKLRSGEFVEQDIARIGKDGADVWLHACSNPIRNSKGEISHIMEFAIDVTERKIGHVDLSEKWRATDASHALCEFEPDGKIVTANEAFLRIFGHSRRDIEGNHHSMLCSPDHIVSQEYRDFWVDLSKGETQSGVFSYVARFGRDVHLQAHFQPIRNSRNEVSGVVMFAIDITDYELERHQHNQIVDQAEGGLSDVLSAAKNILAGSEAISGAIADHKSAMISGEKILEENLTDISGVSTDIEKISEIVDVLGEIAVQTNLLAFNAAIEAARAGEHGVGFSIVADEVRKLAERNSEAARDISRQIDAASSRVERNEANTQKSVRLVRQTHENMNSDDGVLDSLKNASTTQVERLEHVGNNLRVSQSSSET